MHRLLIRLRSVVDGARLRIESRIDEGKEPPRPQPVPGQLEEGRKPRARHVAEPETAEQGVHLAVRFGPGIAYVEMGAQSVGEQSFTRKFQWSARSVVQGKLALDGEQRRPPSRPRRELDDLAPDRQRVQPAPGLVKLRRPRDVVDRPSFIAAAAQIPRADTDHDKAGRDVKRDDRMR